MQDNKTRTSRSFVWLNVTQFLGALNDNVFKLLVVFLLVEVLGEEHRAVIVARASAVFVLPFLLFSHAAGVLADRISKRKIVVLAKCLEFDIMALGCAAIYFRNPIALYSILFLMCTQSTLFGPAKYGIIPELVSSAQLSRANSQLVGLTYLAIIVGTFVPSYLLLNVLGRSFLGLGLFCVGLAAIGITASLRIEKTPAAGSRRKFSPFFLRDLFRTLCGLSKDRYLFFAVVGAAYFLFLGGLIQQNALLYGRDCLGLSWIASGYIFPVAALGIGLGAWLAGAVSGRNIEFGVVPIGAFGLAATCLALGLITPAMKSAMTVIFLIGLSSGLFIVPLNAFIQYRSPPQRRGEILACQNFLSFSGVAISAGAIYLLYEVLGLRAEQVFVVGGALTAILAVATISLLPDFLVRFVMVVVTRCLYRVTIRGGSNIPVEGGALLVSNHVTYMDALLIGATMQRRIRFVMARDVYEKRWLKPLFKLMQGIPVSPTDHPRRIVASLNEARDALNEGYLVCIFAEGALTRNGNMRGFRPGLERIVKGTDHPIIPVHIGGAWGSIFSYAARRLFFSMPRRIPYPVSVLFGKPMPSTTSSAETRRAVLELSCESVDMLKNRRRTLPRRFIETARRHRFKHMMSDTTGKRLRFGQALAAALALRSELRRMTGNDRMVGVLLPPSAGAALTNYAISLNGRIAVNLNFTASRESIASAIGQCEIKTIVSSRAFIDKVGDSGITEEIVFLEDILPRISWLRRIAALLNSLFAPAGLILRNEPGPDDIATVIFSSGSTGQPKGVMLSHHNLISDVNSFALILKMANRDRMCACLPFFHSFGFTTNLWGPPLVAYSVCFHHSPMDGAKIAEIVREEKLTILPATPTFLLSYIRRAKRDDFKSLRAVITGAEKLSKRVANAFEEHFHIRPLEGYGTTELSPVAAVNVPDIEFTGVTQVGTKEGSVGHPIPGVAARIVHPDSGETLPEGADGLLLVKGPNVMQGYLSSPEKTAAVLRDGWYNTGDIARIDENGFIFIVDRLSRYSKIGGEMVPHLRIEEEISKKLGILGRALVVTSAADDRKGEQLVVCFTEEAGDVDDMHRVVKESDLPNLWKPRKENYLQLREIPQLASGKLDLRNIRRIAQEFVDRRPGRVQRAVDALRKGL